VLLILLVIFGVPQQMPTILGLVTAGLPVVFQDFILAFCGWFVLMGPSGGQLPRGTDSYGASRLDLWLTLSQTAMFAELKNYIGLRRLRLRRMRFVREQFYLAATAQNPKRLVRFLSGKSTPQTATA
jgi:hypothetical protein